MHGGNIWPNLLTWIDLYRQGRCRHIVDLDLKTPRYRSEEWPNREVELAIKAFDLVDELLEKNNDMTVPKLRKAVSKHRRTMMRLYS